MAKSAFESVDQYIAAQPKEVQRLLTRVRRTIRKAVPDADEVIAYQIPAYKRNGRVVLYFAGWKNHFSLYPSNECLVARFKKDLAPYDVNDKGTIRFPLSEPLPVKLIAAIARFRAKEVEERGKTKSTHSRKPRQR